MVSAQEDVAVRKSSVTQFPTASAPIDPDRAARTTSSPTPTPISALPVQGFRDSDLARVFFCGGPLCPDGWAEDYKVWLRVSRSSLVLPMKIEREQYITLSS